MTTSSFPTNTFSLYADRRDTRALERIAARRRRVQRWARPLTAGIIVTSFAFTAYATLRDGGESLEASWRNASRPKVTVRARANAMAESVSASAWSPNGARAGTQSSSAVSASLTGPVPGLVAGSSSVAAGAGAEAPPAPRAEAPQPETRPAPAAVAAPRAPAPTLAAAKASRPSRKQVSSQLGALDKLSGDIMSQLK